jgi:hypothetical protein
MREGIKHTKDFTAEERAVIRERLRYQDSQTLAAVFGTSPRVINNIARYS